MFESKYIKYDPSITCEIFDKIINRLTELYGKSNRWEKTYDQFKTWGFIVIFNAPTKSHFNWSVDNNKQNSTEITVQELLGYDPFISDNLLEGWLKETKDKSFSLCELRSYISYGTTCPREAVYLKLKGNNVIEKAQILYTLWNSKEFTLPSKWRVLATSEAEGKLLIPYANEGFKVPTAWRTDNVQNYWLCVGPGTFNSLSKLSDRLSEYEEITFAQFKQYVLKETSVKTGIDWTKVSKEDLLIEANKRYPLGTKYRSRPNRPTYMLESKLIVDSYNNVYDEDRNCHVFLDGKWAEIVELAKKDWNKCSQTELQAEAEKRYPIGTKCISLDSMKNECVIKSLTHAGSNSSEIWMCGDTFNPCVYKKGSWAEIISTSKDWNKRNIQEVLAETIRRYPVGTVVKSPIYPDNKYIVKTTPIIYKNLTVISDGDGKVTLFDFDKNTWAEIVKETQPKEWAVGTYFVFLRDYGGHPKGTIDKIIKDNGPITVKSSLFYNGSSDNCNLRKDNEAKWFATKSEAEVFVKTQFAESRSTEEDLTGRYLRATVDYPQSTSLKKGDVIKIVSKHSSNYYKLEKNWNYTTDSSTASNFEVLPKNYKPESTSLNLNFQHNQFYKVTLLKHSYVFLFTDSKLEKERINVIIYYDCSNKKCCDGGFIYLKDITACEWIPTETVKRDYSELYLKLYPQPKYQYEEGKWYSVVKDQSCNNFRKCCKSSNNNICTYDEMIYNGKHSKQHGNAAWDIAFPADMEVVNSIIKGNINFVINDWVYFLGTDSSLCTSYWRPGKVCQVVELRGNSLGFEYVGGPSNYKNQFRKATTAEIFEHMNYQTYKNFKVGDYITIVQHPKFWSSLCVNKNLLDKVTYPFTAEITKLTIEHGDCGIEAGDGGWSLDRMINDGTVRKATSEEIGNLIHKGIGGLLTYPDRLASEHSIICQSKPKKDEFEFIMLPEE